MKSVALAAALALLIGCAVQQPPSGGPPDTEPPVILETVPVTGTTNYEGNTVFIQFNEYVDRQSVQQSIHISPLSAGTPEFDWGGKDVTIILDDELEPDQTYVIAIGTSVKDLNAGNTMAASHTIAFSTGDSIDMGTAVGRLFDATPDEVSIFGYLLDSYDPDTLNPSGTQPQYVVQTGMDGSYTFTNLKEGAYRFFAVRDKQQNNIYDIEADDVGMPLGDLQVRAADSLEPPSMRFRLTTEDTTSPYIQSVEVATVTTLQFRLSEPPANDPPALEAIAIRDSATGEMHAALSIYQALDRKYAYNITLSPPMEEGRKYYFDIDSLADAAGNFAKEEGREILFEGVSVPDTARPDILALKPAPPGAKLEPDSAIVVEFSRPLTGGQTISVTDTSGNEIAFEKRRLARNRLAVQIAGAQRGMQYTVCMDLETFVDTLNALPIADSTFCYAVQVPAEDKNGSIAGTVKAEVDSVTAVYVRARAASGNYTEKIKARAGAFVFPAVPEGKYILDAYIDADGDTEYSFGKPFPFVPAERFGIAGDTIRVRARWESKNVVIPIPE